MAKEKETRKFTPEWIEWATKCKKAQDAIENTTIFSGARADAETQYQKLIDGDIPQQFVGTKEV